MRFLVLLDWNDMQFAMPHTVGGHHLVRKKPDQARAHEETSDFCRLRWMRRTALHAVQSSSSPAGGRRRSRLAKVRWSEGLVRVADIA